MPAQLRIDGELFGRKFRWWIVVSGNGIAIFIVIWLLSIIVGGVVESFDLARGLLLLGYMLSWVLGTNFDLAAQRRVYINIPTPQVPRLASIVVTALAIAGAVLFVSRGDRIFAVVLSLFFALNVASWYLFQDKVREIINSSRDIVQNTYRDRVPLLNIVADYITGRWQWGRFAAMLVIIAAADLVSFSPRLRDLLAFQIHNHLSSWPTSMISTILPLACLAAFIIVAEGWVWSKRLKVHLTKRQLDALETRASQENTTDTVNVANNAVQTKQRGRTVAKTASPRSHSPTHRFQWPRYLWVGHGAAFVTTADSGHMET